MTISLPEQPLASIIALNNQSFLDYVVLEAVVLWAQTANNKRDRAGKRVYFALAIFHHIDWSF